MNENIVDDQGTTQAQAHKMLENLLANGFDNDSNQLAMVLGRTPDEIRDILDKNDTIDDDLAMKIRGIANERDISIE